MDYPKHKSCIFLMKTLHGYDFREGEGPGSWVQKEPPVDPPHWTRGQRCLRQGS